MGYGRDEHEVEEVQLELSVEHIKAAEYFQMGHDEWLDESHAEQNRLSVLAKRMQYI